MINVGGDDDDDRPDDVMCTLNMCLHVHMCEEAGERVSEKKWMNEWVRAWKRECHLGWWDKKNIILYSINSHMCHWSIEIQTKFNTKPSVAVLFFVQKSKMNLHETLWEWTSLSIT